MQYLFLTSQEQNEFGGDPFFDQAAIFWATIHQQEVFMGTIRRRMIEILKEDELDALDLSQIIGIREREVYGHLNHIKKTITARGERFIMTPTTCLGCGYVFKERARLNRPGRCPECKGTRLSRPTYRID